MSKMPHLMTYDERKDAVYMSLDEAEFYVSHYAYYENAFRISDPAQSKQMAETAEKWRKEVQRLKDQIKRSFPY